MSWKKVIGAVAPALATALGGPLAGTAVKQIADKVLGNPEASQAEVEAAMMSASPEMLVKLRELDQEFAAKMAAMGIELAKLEVDDRKSARDRQVAMRDQTPTIIASVIVVGFVVVQAWLLNHEVPTNNREAVVRALGILDASLMLVLGYYFGSSLGSRLKDEKK